MTFRSAVTKFPYVRTAIVATNLISPKKKVVDGVARLIVKTTLATLSRKDNLLTVQAAEALLSESWDELQRRSGMFKDAFSADAIYGRLSSRAVLFIFKEATGRRRNLQFQISSRDQGIIHAGSIGGMRRGGNDA